MISRIAGLIVALLIAVLMLLRIDINGWGSLVWLMASASMGLIRSPFEAETKVNTIDRKESSETEGRLLFGVMLGSALILVVHLLTGILGFANYVLPDWSPAVAIPILAAGLWLFWRSHVDLGRNWSVTTELRHDHTLVNSGVYERVRHPMYTAIWTIFGTYPLLIHNWIAGFAAIVAFGLMYVIRVPYEESMMVDRFGNAYLVYRKETGRLWPRLR